MWGGFQAPPGPSRGPPGLSRGVPRFENFMQDGQVGLGHPPWRWGGLATVRGLQRGSKRGFLRDLNALKLDASANILGSRDLGKSFVKSQVLG